MDAVGIVVDYIKNTPSVEGCKLVAYPDKISDDEVWTIGYGCTGADIKKGTVWTQEQADTALKARVTDAYSQAVKSSPILASQSEYRKAAVTEFVYNLGIGHYNSSTLKKLIDAGNFPAASKEFIKWNKSGGEVRAGLTARRRQDTLWFGK